MEITENGERKYTARHYEAECHNTNREINFALTQNVKSTLRPEEVGQFFFFL